MAYDLNRCVVVENWSDPGGHEGRNLDAYNAEDKLWHRFFVDSRGHVHVFQGAGDGASVQYEGVSKDSDGHPVLNRLTIREDSANRKRSGYKNSSSFSAMFRKALGSTPGKYFKD